MYYYDNAICYYSIQTTITNAAIYGQIEVAVDYFFASQMYIMNGDDFYLSTNLTVPVARNSYRFGTLGS
eukprot:CAMPEP_0202965624 /NCGR_PEP_ID=MMETSP1396-20130829/9531_1 /ASSEMBLY_ACC=CAM_ASM_000872 /TAXON_ID= /ORGANISM="Pseudokeronopsis sp., Strain Brazil" /LENGTH=68 /DNA_ID=CAMNT_0049688391 /DNA_START=302 /DNA_END=508 /DNA_ORIENTATION=-